MNVAPLGQGLYVLLSNLHLQIGRITKAPICFKSFQEIPSLKIQITSDLR